MPKPYKEQIETATINHDGDETSDRIARTYIRLGALLERHKDQIDREGIADADKDKQTNE
jgi:hypothetical protein